MKRGGHGLNSDFSFCTLVTNVFRVFLIILFILHLYFSIEKFANQGTTDTLTNFYANELSIPSITLCKQGYKNLTIAGMEFNLASLDTLCSDYAKLVIPGANSTNTTALNVSSLDAADIWNRCIRDRFYAKTDNIEKVNLVPGRDAFYKFLGNVSDDGLFQFIPFFSKFGHCYTVRPNSNRSMKTNMNDSTLVLKVIPGMYTVMIHDPKVLPFGIGMMDTYRITPFNLVIPDVALPNGTMQYALIPIMDKSVSTPRLLSRIIFGGWLRSCVDNQTWYNNLQMAIVKKIGCQLDFHNWFIVTNTTPICKTKRDMDNYFTNMSLINNYHPLLNISRIFNIPPLCTVRVIDASVSVKPSLTYRDFPHMNKIDNVSNSGSYMMFYYNSSRVVLIQEMTVYDGSSLVGEIGGSLFLFVALTLTHIITVLRMGGRRIIRKNKF